MQPPSNILRDPIRPPRAAGATPDLSRLRQDFPILHTQSHGKPLVYLDNGATTQKPRQVIDAIQHYYESQNANIHRGLYELSQLATHLYDQAREKTARFINAADPAQIIFTRGTTEGINLVAATFGRAMLSRDDQIIISAMEHHSNIVPWQILAQQTGATLRIIPMNDAGELLLDEFAAMLSPAVKIVSVVHLSNSLGTINDIKRIVQLAHGVGAKVLVDGAQWIAHHPTDVQDLDCDFYVFSGHKMFGPTGIGVLYGKRDLLEQMPPYQSGGDMIESVTFAKTTFAPLPNKFEAGTPNIAGAVGLAAAIDYLTAIGFDALAEHEQQLLAYATDKLQTVPGLRIIGTAKQKGSVISFVLENPPIASFDLGTALDARGIAVRTGHHCCQPVMDRMGISGTTRMSLAFYNTTEDIDVLAAALKAIVTEQSAKRPSTHPAPAQTLENLQYSPAAGTSPQAVADQLAADFELLGDRDARTSYVLELGEKLLPMPALLKTEGTRVHGCMSTVHLFGRKRPGTSDTMEFLADSDAHIVRGLIALLQRLYSGQRTAEVLSFDIEGFLRRIGLDQFISSQRRNGLAGMIGRIRRLANEVASGNALPKT